MTSLWDGMLAANQADTDCLIGPAAGMPHVPYDLRTGLKTRPSYIGTHNTVYRTQVRRRVLEGDRSAASKARAWATLREPGAATKPRKRHGRVYARPAGAMLARRPLSYNREERALSYNREARAF